MTDSDRQKIQNHFLASIALKQKVSEGDAAEVLVKMAVLISASIQSGGKLMLCGNGGSAADAQHLAAELLVRLRPTVNRRSLSALTLATDISTLTACGNDYSFDDVFSRPLEGLGRAGDVVLGITTSGFSRNVIKALSVARDMGIATLGFLGKEGGDALEYCDVALVVPADETGLIQEVHISAGHALMAAVEDLILAETDQSS